MLAIRLQRVGKRNNPAFRVVLMDARRSAKSGDFLEILGSYNPQHEGSLSIKKDQISHWLSKGAQPSDTVHNLLVREKVIDAPKRNVVAPSKFKKPEAAPQGDSSRSSESGAGVSLVSEEREKPAAEVSVETKIESISEPVEKSVQAEKPEPDKEESPSLEKGE